MNNNSAAPPVLLLIFNRPDLTVQSFATVRAARPERLFIAGDGPRPSVGSDAENVTAARAATEHVDWSCSVETLFRDDNLGCAGAVSSAIDWAFTKVDELIILEDDCLPSPSFFPYCSELLARYRNEPRLFAVSGDRYQPRTAQFDHSYYFSRYPHCWGWATWKRAWRHFDFAMARWPGLRGSGWPGCLFHDPLAARYWRRIFDRVAAGEIDSWAYRWTYSCWVEDGLTALPATNLVKNIGFGEAATHENDGGRHSHPTGSLSFPLTHPDKIERNQPADRWTQLHHFGLGEVNWTDRILNRIRSGLRLVSSGSGERL